ncbi:Cell division cycle-associated protein 7 [Nibea albiflora]|uniref:Cell division cycle-associated protein 7 n=1 Tax=Nibea albiflora TaxID=240163 RepID=A0ACB7EF15_NIBAL|nr:Cell division cycle-associated protein 7 [Nibea albiflora]
MTFSLWQGEIEKLTNDYLGLVHFPPLLKDELEKEVERSKTVNLELVFGYHWKPGTSKSDCKWKMYIELDGDDVAVTYIKDIVFNANRQDVEVLRMTKPPFVMDKWIIGIQENQKVDCTVNYENDVKAPKTTRYSCPVTWSLSGGQNEIKTVELVIETTPSNIDCKPGDKCNFDIDPTWMYNVRQRQMMTQKSQQTAAAFTAFSDARTLPQFLSAHESCQGFSYAAAVRRSPNRSRVSPWIDSRSSSPTASLSAKLAPLHLGSKGSSPSSTTSESTLERERDRPLSAGAKLAAQSPSTRMSLRSFRSSPLVPMETSSSSSSDDSCDSFGSDGGFANTRSSLRQTRRTAQKPKVFEATSEEDTCSGFDDNVINSQMKAMKVDSDSPRRGRRSNGLKIAMTFPTKKTGKKRPASEPLPQSRLLDSDSDEEENFMNKRALNIKENKEMLAKLMAELHKVPGLFPRRMAMSASTTEKPGAFVPTPHRSRTLVDGPPSPAPEEEPEDKFSLVRKSRYFEEYDEPPRRRSFNGTKAIPHVVRPVDEITELELDRICHNVREKVYNSSTGSTCHQCRQKTIDTKTNCRNPECVGVRGQFCGPCLRNRYGEEVRDALLNPDWQCPPCRGICNCSFCRARDGRCATGVLVYLAKYHGFDNVHAYLKRPFNTQFIAGHESRLQANGQARDDFQWSGYTG